MRRGRRGRRAEPLPLGLVTLSDAETLAERVAQATDVGAMIKAADAIRRGGAELNKLMLKEAFKQAKRVQQRLRLDYGL
jgi:hypothetical protein